MEKTKRLGTIDFFKFLFALIIVFTHAKLINGGLCKCGYIGVEFFFIVSGYLLATKAAKYAGDNVFKANLEMIKHKFLSIFPYLFLAVIAANIFYAIKQFSIITFSKNIILSVSDILGLQMLGFPTFAATGVAWYLSVLFFVSFLLYPILCKKRKLFTLYIAPITILILLGYMLKVYYNLDSPGSWLGLSFKGLLRGYIDISLGCIAYELKLLIDNCNNSKIFGIFEIFGYLFTVIYAVFHNNNGFSFDFFIVSQIMLAISISFSNKSVLKNLFNYPIYNTLGMYSLSLYLNHAYINKFVIRCVGGGVDAALSANHKLLVYLVLVLIISVLNYVLGKILLKYTNSIKSVLICIFSIFIIFQSVFFYYDIYYKFSLFQFHGNGTISNPYKIDNLKKLKSFRNLVNMGYSFENEYIVQTSNIDLKNEEWTPIGIYQSGKYFQGTYDGQNHYVENLLISKSKKKKVINNSGFFGMLNGKVQNFGIESGNIEGDCVGAITSHGNATIINCYNKAALKGDVRAGGIADNISKGKIINCVNYGSATAPQSAEILSYNASFVMSVYPEQNALAESFKGKYVNTKMSGIDEKQLLNSAIDYLKDKKIISSDISKW